MFLSSGEPTPPSVTGGTERGRQPQQPHGAPRYYRPQSFNQAFLGYPRNGNMPYGAPRAGPYGQPMTAGREPWRLDRRTPEAAPQRLSSTEGPFREEGTALLQYNSHVNVLGQVVRKPISANSRLNINRGFHLAHKLIMFLKANFKLVVKKNRSQKFGTKIILKSLDQ